MWKELADSAARNATLKKRQGQESRGPHAEGRARQIQVESRDLGRRPIRRVSEEHRRCAERPPAWSSTTVRPLVLCRGRTLSAGEKGWGHSAYRRWGVPAPDHRESALRSHQEKGGDLLCAP